MKALWRYRDKETWPAGVRCSCGMEWHIESPAPIGCLQHLMGLENPSTVAAPEEKSL